MVSRRRDVAGGLRSFAVPLVIGLAFLAGSPTQTAYQDMVSLVSGVERSSARWGAFVEKSALGSVHQAEMPFLDATPTGSVTGGGLDTPGIGTVALRGKTVTSDSPDEARVTRGDKQGRVVKVAPVAPPRSFNAGSVFERTSSILDPASDVGAEM